MVIDFGQATGNCSATKELAIVHVLYSGQRLSGSDDRKCRRRFTYGDAAEYLSKSEIYGYALRKFDESERRYTAGNLWWRLWEEDRRTDGGETRSRRMEIYEYRMEAKKNTINSDGR